LLKNIRSVAEWYFSANPVRGPDLAAGKEHSITFAASLNAAAQDATLQKAPYNF